MNNYLLFPTLPQITPYCSGDLDGWVALCIQHMKYFTSCRIIFAYEVFIGINNDTIREFLINCPEANVSFCVFKYHLKI